MCRCHFPSNRKEARTCCVSWRHVVSNGAGNVHGMVADMRQQGGFTLIELLTAFSLLLIVLMYSVLDIGRHIRQIGYQSALQQLVAQVARARSEARLQRLPVHVCAANLKSNLDVQGCKSTRGGGAALPWSQGAMLYVDRPGGRSGIYDSKELLQLAEPVSGMTLSLRSAQPQLTFRRDGLLAGSMVEFELKALQDDWCRRLRIYQAGISTQQACL